MGHFVGTGELFLWARGFFDSCLSRLHSGRREPLRVILHVASQTLSLGDFSVDYGSLCGHGAFFFLFSLSLSIIVCAVSCVHDAVAALGQRLASFGPIHRCICHLQSALTGLGTRGQSPLTGRVPFGLASRATCFFVTFVRDASGECVDRLAVGQTI